MSSQLTGVAGVHYVAAQLSYIGYHAVPTVRNVPGPDMLVSNLDGSKLAAIQVKTTGSALRKRGRGVNRKPHHYEWDAGHKAATIVVKNLFYAFVDLKEFKVMPDIFIVPSSFLVRWFKKYGVLKRYRFHPLIKEMEGFKNNWSLLRV